MTELAINAIQVMPNEKDFKKFSEKVDLACQVACDAIAPAWPLDQSIAVNPYWKRINRPLRQVAARMAVLGNINVFPSREYIQAAWENKEISRHSLKLALEQNNYATSLGVTPYDCIDSLNNTPAAIINLPLLIDVLDDDLEKHKRLSWRQAITHQVSQTCAAYFDRQQAEWKPSKPSGLYQFWRESLTHDHGIGLLMGLPHLGKSIDKLPKTSKDAEQWVMRRLGLSESVWADYLEAVLLTVNGWASWCAYLQWQADLAGKKDTHLRELLAIRLAWGAILLDCKEDGVVDFSFRLIQKQWQFAEEALKEAEETLVVDEVWQHALEIGYQQKLANDLNNVKKQEINKKPSVQAAFCIDVRSERFRRALESVCPAAQTFGVAGFFGLPIAYQPFATNHSRPQLPGLLAPSIKVTDQLLKPEFNTKKIIKQHKKAKKMRSARYIRRMQWSAASQWPSAAFSFVEVAGFGYLRKLRKWITPSTNSRVNDDYVDLPNKYKKMIRPTLQNADLESEIRMAESMLKAMGLKDSFAPLFLLVGHGSQSDNNAHSASLDCGACCGQTGEVNSRVLANMLNNKNVRDGLQKRGIHIPVTTTFIAALHNTTTDEIEVFDLDLVSKEAQSEWQSLVEILDQAGHKVRKERSKSLNIDKEVSNKKLLNRYRRRANDGAQTRPEFGLTNNAAFIIASRDRTKNVNLDGRTFLHEYHPDQDQDGALLEQLMTAPMLVTHWINWQYHASMSDPSRMGSGNKLLHNVVGGNLGVYEGNGGDLRIGLSKQSLHDGEKWVHQPVRLTVVIDAPTSRIDDIIAKHLVVKQLVENKWLHLWSYKDDGSLAHHCDGRWLSLRQ